MVIDLQDIGTRFYTYPDDDGLRDGGGSETRHPVVVLDRPNPIGGWQIEGPTLDQAAFTGYLPAMPIRHGLTIGELARLFNSEARINCDARRRDDGELARGARGSTKRAWSG